LLGNLQSLATPLEPETSTEITHCLIPVNGEETKNLGKSPLFGAGGGTRTRTPSLAPDFESGASTNSTTPAMCEQLSTKTRSIALMVLHDVFLRRGDRLVFDELSLAIQAHRTGLVGLNGSGKTSLLRLLMGLETLEQGRLENDKPVGLVFQSPNQQILFPTVMEELCFGQLERGMDPTHVEAKAKALANAHGAEGLLKRSTHECSEGEKQLVCILAVLMDEPQVLLFDEPFASLDARATRAMMRLIEKLPQQVVMASHNLDLLHDFDELIWMDQGQVRMQGPVQQMRDAFLTFAQQEGNEVTR
jgi:biotin transport system ATP-binding protein